MITLRKEIARAGNYQMGNGEKFTVSRERIRHWADTFNEMNSMKINVPTCKDHQCDAEHTVGCISKMEAEGDSLYALMEFPREQEAELAKVNDVSIATKDKLITGVKTFDDAIEHVALTPRPVVPGLQGYSLLCSLGDIQPATPSNDSTSTKPLTPPTTSTPSGSGNGGKDAKGGTSVYALQKAMEIVSRIFGVAIPPEASMSEEAAIAYLSTVQACKEAGIMQEMKPAPASQAPINNQPSQTQNPSDDGKAPNDGEGEEWGEGGEGNEPGNDGDPGNDTKPGEGENDSEPVSSSGPDGSDGVNGSNGDSNTEPAAGLNQPQSPEDDEPGKKKKTPGEDGIIASLNDYRKMKILSMTSRVGLPTSKVQEKINRFCLCKSQEEYFNSMGEFESFQGGLELSLNSVNPAVTNILTSTLTGPQVGNGGENSNKRVPAFVQMARSASNTRK